VDWRFRHQKKKLLCSVDGKIQHTSLCALEMMAANFRPPFGSIQKLSGRQLATALILGTGASLGEQEMMHGMALSANAQSPAL
jgi:hypothetical protein